MDKKFIKLMKFNSNNKTNLNLFSIQNNKMNIILSKYILSKDISSIIFNYLVTSKEQVNKNKNNVIIEFERASLICHYREIITVVKLYNNPDIRMVDIMGKNFYREEYLKSKGVKPQIVLGPMDWKCY
jgi:hypothetical protein